MVVEWVAIGLTVALAAIGGAAKLIQVLVAKYFRYIDMRLDSLENKFDAFAKNLYASEFKYRSKDDCALIQGALENKLRTEFKSCVKELEVRIEAQIRELKEEFRDLNQ